MADIQALGLHDPVFGSQTAFRQIMAAMSSPGKISHIPADLSGAPDGLSPAAAATILTLCDYETPIFFGRKSSGYMSWIKFYTGAFAIESPRDAKFALLDGHDPSHPFHQFHQGDDRYPDLSATLIIECKAITGGPRIRLTGPGIQVATEIAPSGLYASFWQELAANNAQFPLGVDVILTAGHEFLALPRSIRIEEIV